MSQNMNINQLMEIRASKYNQIKRYLDAVAIIQCPGVEQKKYTEAKETMNKLESRYLFNRAECSHPIGCECKNPCNWFCIEKNWVDSIAHQSDDDCYCTMCYIICEVNNLVDRSKDNEFYNSIISDVIKCLLD